MKRIWTEMSVKSTCGKSKRQGERKGAIEVLESGGGSPHFTTLSRGSLEQRRGLCWREFSVKTSAMSSLVKVAIHPSQFPGSVRRDLIESLRTRRINHKFHYDSVNQAQKWLALHQAYSPSRTDPGCAAIYEFGFEGAVQRIAARGVHLIGLGCGGGQKDSRLLWRLKGAGKEVYYTPEDVSTAMVLAAREVSLAVISEERCFPLVCDLATADDLKAVLDAQQAAGTSRLVTFFGMIPNFEPEVIMPRVAGLLAEGDHLLFSANLAPGTDYAAGVQRILPLYDNELTRDWLLVFLRELGVDVEQGKLNFVIEENPCAGNLKRVAAYYQFRGRCLIAVDEERFEFNGGDTLRIFFSYRHTPRTVEGLLTKHGLRVIDQWITDSQEEGVFLCGRE
jgi:uncharacterized SAM-dependent methyltransferase